MLDNSFGGWYKNRKLEISNFVGWIFHKLKKKGGEDFGGVVIVNFVSGLSNHDTRFTKH
jgi:hypothetical protein